MNDAGRKPLCTKSAAVRRSAQSSAQLRRLGAVEEVAEAVRFLVCGAGYISGQVIAVDGGRSLTGGM